MGKVIAAVDRFEAISQKIETALLPQQCQIFPPKRTITASGNKKEGLGDALVWRGKTYIPCRLDTSRHYRQGEIFQQEITLSEFELILPADAPIRADHKVLVDEQYYEVRKLMTGEGYETTRSALLSRIDLGVS